MCLRVSVVPLGEQQSLSEDGGVWWVEGAPQDIGILVRRVLGGPVDIWGGLRVPQRLPKCWGGPR